jgi:hypothetical protein
MYQHNIYIIYINVNIYIYYLYLSIYLSIYLPIYLSIYLSIYNIFISICNAGSITSHPCSIRYVAMCKKMTWMPCVRLTRLVTVERCVVRRIVCACTRENVMHTHSSCCWVYPSCLHAHCDGYLHGGPDL